MRETGNDETEMIDPKVTLLSSRPQPQERSLTYTFLENAGLERESLPEDKRKVQVLEKVLADCHRAIPLAYRYNLLVESNTTGQGG